MVKRKRKSIVKLAYLLGILILFVFFCGLQYCDGGKQHTYTQLADYVCVCVICEAFSTEKMRIECTSTKHKHCEKYIVPFSTFTHQNSFVQLPRTNRTKKKHTKRMMKVLWKVSLLVRCVFVYVIGVERFGGCAMGPVSLSFCVFSTIVSHFLQILFVSYLFSSLFLASITAFAFLAYPVHHFNRIGQPWETEIECNYTQLNGNRKNVSGAGC